MPRRVSKLWNNSITRGDATPARAWVELARRRARRRLRAPLATIPPAPEEPPLSDSQRALIGEYAPNRAFADIGALYKAHGAAAFLAADHGATTITAFDEAPVSEEFKRTNSEHGDRVRFVQGDLHSAEAMDAIGVHDVVWCTGVLYHTPNPRLAIERLQSIAGEYLIVGSKTIPEVPGLPGMAVYLPGLSQKENAAYAPLWGDAIAYRPDWTPTASWWWGLTPSALRGLVTAPGDWRVVEEVQLQWTTGRYDNTLVVARRSP